MRYNVDIIINTGRKEEKQLIKSMTGFGRGEYTDGKRNITVEIKAVNHRYADISVKMPRRYGFAEEKIKAQVKETLRRGKVEVSVMVENITENDINIKLNLPLARQYYENLKTLKESFSLGGELTLELLANMPEVVKAMADVEDEEEITRAILIPVSQAALDLENMRRAEGEKLAADLREKGRHIKSLLDKIEERAPGVVRDYTQRLRQRITELLDGSAAIPEERILTEAAIFADKSAIDEEITRLNSHLSQLERILSADGEAQGKKLDFLVQEMNREANTIGSKANDITITGYMLEIKSEIEKIREQVQNIE